MSTRSAKRLRDYITTGETSGGKKLVHCLIDIATD